MQAEYADEILDNDWSNKSGDCGNCGAKIAEVYCTSCGQKRITERITMRKIGAQAAGVLTNVEEGFTHTFIELLWRPGKMLRAYMQGGTKPYYNPFRYVFVAATFSTILMVSLGIFEMQYASMQETMSVAGMEQTAEQAALQAKIGEYMVKYMNIFILFLIPFIALFTKLFFRKANYNFAEHFVACAYLYGQVSLLGILVLPFYWLLPNFIDYAILVSMIIMVGYFAYAYKRWLSEKAKMVYFKMIFAFLLGYIGFMMVSMIIGIVIGIGIAISK